MAIGKMSSWLKPLFETLRRNNQRRPHRRAHFSHPRLELLEDRLAPATHTWVDAGGSHLWSDPLSWDIGAPAIGEQNINLIFPSTVLPHEDTVDDNPGLVVDSLTFTDTGYNVLGINHATGSVSLRILKGIFDNAGGNTIGGNGNLIIQLGPANGVNTSPIEFLEGSAGRLTVSSALLASDSLQLVIGGSGAVQLDAANSIGGRVNIESGAGLEIGNDNALGGATLQFDGGSLSAVNGIRTINNPILLVGGGTIQGSNEVIVDGPISSLGPVPLTLNTSSSSPVVLNSPNTYSGGTFVSGGGVAVGNNSALGTGPITFSGPTSLIEDVSGITLDNSMTLTGDLSIVVFLANQFTLNGTITGIGGLQEFGGQLVLNGSNTYTGHTVDNLGALEIGNNSALGNGLLVMKDGTLLDGLVIDSGGFPDTVLKNPIELDGSVITAGDSLALLGDITGTGSLVDATTQLALFGTNSYQGATSVETGDLVVDSANALPSTTALTIAQNAEVGLNFFDITVGSLAGSGTILTEGIRSITTGEDNTNTIFSGTITAPFHFPVASTLTKVGSGLFTFSGTGFYTGATTIAGGILQLDGTLNGSIIVDSGTALTGTGSVEGSGIQTSGVIFPGDLTTGILTTSGATVFQTGSRLTIPLVGTTPGTGFSQLISGSVDLSASPVLSFILDFTPAIGTSFTILSANSITGIFAGLPAESLFSIGGAVFQIHYSATSVVITAVVTPNPTISSLSSVTEGAPAGTLTVTGTGFVNNLTFAQLDGVYVPIQFQSNTQVQIPVPAEEGQHTITLTNFGAGTVSQLFNVADASLSASGISLTAIEQGVATGMVATVSDPVPESADSYTAFINWGDGNTTLGIVKPYLGNFSVIGSHTYLEEGNYSVTTTILDEGGATATAVSAASVSDAALFGIAKTVAFTEGSSKNGIIAAFFDADPRGFSGQYTATINWGDGSTSSANVVADGAGFDVTGNHAYAEEGTYAIAATIQDVGGASATINSTAIVSDAALAVAGANVNSIAGAPFRGVLASFTDADPNGAAADFSATISWGDGTNSAGTVAANGQGGFTVSGNTTYASAGTYTAHVTIRDAGGSQVAVDSPANVTSLGLNVQRGQAAGTGFWRNSNGQALINSFNGGATSTALSAWLAATFPNLYGAPAGSNNLTGETNAQVAAFYQIQLALRGSQVQAQVLATALSVYATTTSLGGTAGAQYGFIVSATGLGARSFSTGKDGAAFGVANNTTLNVYQLLLAVNKKAVNGILFNGDTTLQAEAADLFNALNKVGGI